MSEWIKCSDRMPEPNVSVLAFWRTDHIEGAFITEEPDSDGSPYWVFDQDGDSPMTGKKPTHWMPLPTPPADPSVSLPDTKKEG